MSDVLCMMSDVFRCLSSEVLGIQKSDVQGLIYDVTYYFLAVAHQSKCDFLVLSGDKWREKNFLLSDKSA